MATSLDEIINFINNMNPNLLLAIAAVSGAFYVITGVLSKIVTPIKNLLEKIFCYELEIYYTNPHYEKCIEWLKENSDSIYFARSFKAVKTTSNNHPYIGDDDNDTPITDDGIVAGYGTAWIKLKDFPPILFERKQDTNKKASTDQIDSLEFKIITTDKTCVTKLYNMIAEYSPKKDKFTKIYTSTTDWWNGGIDIIHSYPPITEQSKLFINDVKHFLDREQWYRDRGLQYKRGYLLFGPPGGGKSQVIKYISKTYGMDIYQINLSKSWAHMDELMPNIKRNSIILVEDIDLSGLIKRDLDGDAIGESNPFNGKEMLQKFLNVLDGISSYDSCIFVCTTNNINALDSALLRPGRIDAKFEIGNLSDKEQLGYFNNFFSVNYTLTSKTPANTIAQLQNICVSNSLESAAKILKFKPLQ